MLGEIALYSFIVLLLTGVYLTLFFKPSHDRGRLQRLATPCSTASRCPRRTPRPSTSQLRRPRRPAHAADPPLGGAALRRGDHGAPVPGLLHRRVPQAARAQLADRRRPADAWASLEGFAGYSLPDDLLSGTGLRIAEGIMQSRPAGRHLPRVLRLRRRVPRDGVHPPAVHRARAADPGHHPGADHRAPDDGRGTRSTPSTPGPAAPTTTSSASRCFPIYTAKAGGFFFIVFGVIALLSALVPDQPGLDVRPVHPDRDHRGLPARLVHRLARRRAAPDAQLGDHRVGSHPQPRTS